MIRNKIYWLVVTALILGSCASKKPLINEISPSHYVYHTAEGATVVSFTSFFSDSLADALEHNNRIDETGDDLLEEVIQGYKDFTQNYQYTDDRNEAEWAIQIDEIMIRKGIFSFNIPHPGPILKVSMLVSIWDGRELKHTLTYSARANMSQINFADEAIHWMSKEEKADPEFQLNTFNEALRELYEKLYFESFGITL